MYAYRYRHLKKKKINGAVWLGGLLLAVIGILLQTNRSFFAKLGEEGAKSCCEKVLDFYLPGLSYSVKDETEWSFVEKVIDVLSEEAVKKDYTTSDLDKILATVSNAQSTVYYENDPASIDAAFASIVERLMNTEDADGSLQTSKDLLTDAMNAIVDELTDTYYCRKPHCPETGK